MTNLLTRYNVDKIIKVIGELEGQNIMIDDTWLHGVECISIEYVPIDIDIPEEARDGSEENTINISFIFSEGKVVKSFCPEREVCEVWHETDELIVFNIRTIDKYVEHEKYKLDSMLKEYKEYMDS